MYPFKQYRFVEFQKSRDLKHKYNAVIQNRLSGVNIVIPFGGTKTTKQYNDTVPLGLYIHLNDNDEKKRDKWREKKIKEGAKLIGYSPYYFEYFFLES